ncbi:MAG: HAD family hydrolase [Rhodospirillales bacterium]|nr:HAD family hydrolase [Alphaproteobacteria bacterium]MBL6947556.1 HAD family hydrolase [Rhodospirillales bacterium]
MSTSIKAISFDLWDTLVDDDSDEPKRQALGLRPKPDERRYLLWEALNRHEAIDPETVNAAFDAADAAFNKAWKGYSITWKVSERLAKALSELGRTLPGDDLAKLADDLGRMEVDIPPNLVDGVVEALEELSGRYKLCIVSDAIVTPGQGLRRMLDGHGLLKYFQAFAFSDEVGRSKPHADIFNTVADELGVELYQMVHIGDRDHNDIKGPHALGMKAVLFTATRDGDRDETTADAICERYADLPGIIEGLDG